MWSCMSMGHMAMQRTSVCTIQVQVMSKRGRTSLFLRGYNQELGFGTDQVLSQKHQSTSQISMGFA